MRKAIQKYTLEVLWPIPKPKGLTATIRMILEMIRKQYPKSTIWIHSIHVGNHDHLGKSYLDGRHRIPFKIYRDKHHLRPDHLEILFLRKDN